MKTIRAAIDVLISLFRGWTLIEWGVIIAILLLLAAIAIPSASRVNKLANELANRQEQEKFANDALIHPERYKTTEEIKIVYNAQGEQKIIRRTVWHKK